MKKSTSKKNRDATAFLYLRLSRDDNLEGESYSIGNQGGICQGYFHHCKSSYGNSLHLTACAPTLLFMIQMFTIPMLISF